MDPGELPGERGLAGEHQLVPREEAEHRDEYLEAHCGYVAFSQLYARKLGPIE